MGISFTEAAHRIVPFGIGMAFSHLTFACEFGYDEAQCPLSPSQHFPFWPGYLGFLRELVWFSTGGKLLQGSRAHIEDLWIASQNNKWMQAVARSCQQLFLNVGVFYKMKRAILAWSIGSILQTTYVITIALLSYKIKRLKLYLK
jgi:hypothetical protein